jgi:hypothetical protein
MSRPCCGQAVQRANSPNLRSALDFKRADTPSPLLPLIAVPWAQQPSLSSSRRLERGSRANAEIVQLLSEKGELFAQIESQLDSVDLARLSMDSKEAERGLDIAKAACRS